jgi:hypothetical protein
LITGAGGPTGFGPPATDTGWAIVRADRVEDEFVRPGSVESFRRLPQPGRMGRDGLCHSGSPVAVVVREVQLRGVSATRADDEVRERPQHGRAFPARGDPRRPSLLEQVPGLLWRAAPGGVADAMPRDPPEGGCGDAAECERHATTIGRDGREGLGGVLEQLTTPGVLE